MFYLKIIYGWDEPNGGIKIIGLAGKSKMDSLIFNIEITEYNILNKNRIKTKYNVYKRVTTK